MELTKREGQILNRIVEEYIRSAQPVSSQLLERKCDFGVCPATIRNEMQRLTDGGFLSQPHTSAGRIPTDKGYRLFVDNLDLDKDVFYSLFDEIEKEIENSFRFAQMVTKRLSNLSSALVFGYLSEEDILLKEGYKKTLKEPEFEERDYISDFLETVDNFEKNINKFFEEFSENFQVFIGRENPIPKGKNFSLIVAKVRFPGEEKGMVAVLGPKRMPYRKNIGLVNSLNKLLDEF